MDDAWGYVVDKEYVCVMELADEAIALDPSCHSALSARALAYMSVEDYPKALKDLNAAIPLMEFDDEKSGAFTYKGEVLSKMKNRELEEESCYRSAMELDPDDPFAYKAMAELHLRMGRVDSATNLWNEVLDRFEYERKDASIALATIYHKQLDDSERAIAVLSEAIETVEDNGELRRARLDVYYDNDMDDEIRRELEALVGLYPEDRELLLQFAREVSFDDDSEEAEKVCERVLALYPHDYEAYDGCAEVYVSLYEGSESNDFLTVAIGHYSKAIEIRGNVRDKMQSRLYFDRAKAYRNRAESGDRDKAFADLESGKKCDPAHRNPVFGEWFYKD